MFGPWMKVAVVSVGLVGAALTPTTPQISMAAPLEDGLTPATCADLGGVYATLKKTETCTITITKTFTTVEEHRYGVVEPDPFDNEFPYKSIWGAWESKQDVAFVTTHSQVRDGEVSTEQTQSVTAYYDFAWQMCGQWVYNSDGQREGGGLTEVNGPCKDRNLMPSNAPDEQVGPPTQP